MTDTKYLACDLSGIQDYVLGVKSAGKAQAKRLRARSFLLELYERAALVSVRERLGASDDALIRGGGNFTIRLPADADADAIEDLNSQLQARLWDETGGEVQIALGWGESPDDARAHLEYRKRRPTFSAIQNGGGWDAGALSRPPIAERHDTPCQVCGSAPGEEEIEQDDETALHCRYCLDARKLGERLTRLEWMRPDSEGDVHALGVGFRSANGDEPGAFSVRRWIPRGPDGREPLTFEEMSRKTRGDRRLAVIKADVDDMGVRVGEIARDGASEEPPYKSLRDFSHALHSFFLDHIQETLQESWTDMYTIYSGGDDLLMVGPWNVALDFAGALVKDFAAGPGAEYGLTLSAGIALTPYRVPIRHAAERADELEALAKSQDGKNSCAALDAIWNWDRHDAIIGDGKRLAGWMKSGRQNARVPRSLLHRLLGLAESSDPLRAAHWTYQISRNAPRGNRGFRNWADNALQYLETDPKRASEAAASVRYALLATRSGGAD